MTDKTIDIFAEPDAVRRELVLPHSRETVWRALTDRAMLAEWLHPNDFEPRLGHRFTFVIAPKPEVGFAGMTVRSEVLEIDAPRKLVLAWNAEPPVSDTRVSFRLEEESAKESEEESATETSAKTKNARTRLFFEHGGFDLQHPFGKHAFKGAAYGWGQMLEKLESLLSSTDAGESPDNDR